MAQRKSECWLTCVIECEVVDSAMVLAESLRRVKTTRSIAAIISRSLPLEQRVNLHKAFDAIFYTDDEVHFPEETLKPDKEELRAKIFIFLMHVFQKCVFISPNSLVLENMDKLFEDKAEFKFISTEEGLIDLSFYMISPRRNLWDMFWKSFSENGKELSENYLCQWLYNKKDSMSMAVIPDGVVAKFSTKSGIFVKNQAYPTIIQFVNTTKDKSFAEQVKSLKEKNFGILEKIIIATWIEIFGNMLESIKNPISTWFLGYNGNEPIAIIGMSCRYPGANNVEEFWNILYKGEEGIRELPGFRWTKEHSIRVTPDEKKTIAGFLSTAVDEFDARFFGVSPKDATYMDPQTRLLHEIVWESLEDSGIDPLSLYGTRTGIFTGSWMNDYKDIVQGSTKRDFFRTYMGNSIGAAAARLSFLLGLTGPSIATESGCSSAIVALDLAVKSLRSGESNLALTGGVNLLLHPFTSNIMEHIIAPNGRCKTFDSKADGFGRAEGCGVLVLKRLSDALRDRDNIWAVLRGSAVSQEGLSRSIGTPTVQCEALTMQLALEDAHVKPSEVSFVETHGTGTSVGDPMEVAAIAKAYYSPDRKEPLIIGSVKTNVGHTESCSGITGIMKTVLAIQHELIPKHRNMETLNPEISLDSIPATIPLENIPWPKVHGQPRIAGVSSFGITGTDGHVIVQEAPNYKLPKFTLGLERPMHIMKISGKTSKALEELLLEYQTLFSEKAEKNGNFANAAYTANIGRAPFNHRAFIVASNYEDAAKVIQEQKFLRAEVKDGDRHEICFLFTGQGSQYQGMAKSLYETSPVFRVNFDVCHRILWEMYNMSIHQVLWEFDPSSNELSRTIYSQTSIFCIEYCLLKLWKSWGIHPDYVLGHSLGEFAAAVAAGILDLEDALKLVTERSRLIDSLPRGSMLVIKASMTEVEKLMKSGEFDLDIAAVNNPEQTVVAGDTQQIELFLSHLKEQGMKAIILEATHAFHSRYMDPMLEKYRNIAETISYKTGNCNVQYISGMDGRLICDSSEINADYWVRHTREKVNFVGACAALREANVHEYLEVGPQPVLSSFVMTNNEDVQMTCLPSLRRGTDEWNTILNTLGRLYLLGYKVNWKGFDDTYIRNKVSLPFHPFHRKSYWVERTNENVILIHPLLGYSLNNASNLNIFQNDLIISTVPYLKDHCIGNRMVFPGAGYTEICLSAGYCVANGLTDALEPPRRAMRIDDLCIDAPLELKEGNGCRLQVIVDLPEFNDLQKAENMDQPQGFQVKVFHQNTNSEDSDKWVLHASSNFFPVVSTKDSMKKWKSERVQEILSTVEPTSSESFYKRVDDTGLKFGETFRSIKQHWNLKQGSLNSDEVVAEISLPSDHTKYLIHPLIIDAAFQAGILTGTNYDQSSRLKVPVRISSLYLLNPFEKEENHTKCFVHVWQENERKSIFIISENFTPIAHLDGVELIDTNVRTIESVLEQQSSSIPDAWEEVWRPIPGPYTNRCELTPIEPVLFDENFRKGVEILTESKPEKLEQITKTDRFLYLYILNALYELGWEPQLNETIEVSQFCQKFGIVPLYRQLVHFYFQVFEEEKVMQYNSSTKLWKLISIPPSSAENKPEIEELAKELRLTSSYIVVGIYEHIAHVLAKVLKGEESALALLFPTDEDKQQFSADVYYQSDPGRQDGSGFGDYFMSAILKAQREANESDPGNIYRILEVGSGTGSMTRIIMKLLGEIWGNKFEYYYTDISQSFFGKAEKRFEEYVGNMKFAIFNVEESPLAQGIPVNYFDFVVATDVFHATRSLQECMVHVRQTMRPKAALFFIETVSAARDITYLFGLLEGYWRFEDFELRPHHACINFANWAKVLNQSGFRFLDGSRAYEGVFGSITAEADENVDLNSLMVTPFTSQFKKEKTGSWVVFCTGEDKATQQVMNMIHASGFNVVAVLKSSEEAGVFKNVRKTLNSGVAMVTVTADNEDPAEIEGVLAKDNIRGILYGWGADTKVVDQKQVALPFMHIAKWSFGLKKLPTLYVLTRGVHSTNESLTSNPTAATLFGLVKTLKNENSELFVRYIDMESSMDDDLEKSCDQILFELAMCIGSKEAGRQQIVYRDGQRFEAKLIKTTVQTKQDELQLPPSSERYHLVLPQTRLIQDVTFDTIDAKEVGENEVEVKVKAYALNFRDIFAILKPSKQFESVNAVGLDYSGVVVKVGSGSQAGKWKVGDRVFGANFKGDQLPSHLVLEGNSMLRIPDYMTYWEASTLPAVFATSYYCLLTVANMKKGDTVLIHTGSGGVGLAAIQLAKHVGASIITTAGNPRKRKYLGSLGIEHVFHSRNTSYEQDIMRVTNGRGVDIVLNSITGPGFKEATLASCAKNARFVEMSKLNVWSPEEVKALRADVKYWVVDLTSLEHEKWTKLLANMNEYLEHGHIKAIPYVKFDALNIRQALQFFQKAKHVGKVVCVMPEVVKQDGKIKHTAPLFNDESTYLITGGLGGIGFEVCKWMLERGAHSIVLTARTPPKPKIASIIDELNKKGYNIMVRLGDVSNLNDCKKIVDEILQSGSPLRGVMHCAGVLLDNLYGNQTWNAFEATYNPKVLGTWNVHNLTKDMQLEHFVLYSSLSALLGMRSQANHASANCFEDAFAHYRYSMGLPATSINWGQWAQVGCAKDISVTGILPVSVKRMLNGLELALKTQKLQISFSEFESFTNLSILMPMAKSYLDEKLWIKFGNPNKACENLNSEKFWSDIDALDDKRKKIEVVVKYLRFVLRNALYLDANEPINEDANIQDLGVDSLMLVEVKNSIQMILGSRILVTSSLLENCNTIRQIANEIVNRINEDVELEAPFNPLSTEELSQLVYSDCELEECIRNINKALNVKPSSIRTVLITGATGQLGAYTLAELSKKYNNVNKIVCLMRNVEGTTPEQRLEQWLNSMDLLCQVDIKKVECVIGDVTQPNLGMDQEQFDRLAEYLDAVFHFAGKSGYSFREPYRSYDNGNGTDIRSVFVGGTVNVLKFACTKKIKQVFYPSTFVCGIFGKTGHGTLSDDWPGMDVVQTIVSAKLPGQKISKFVCELLIKEASLRGIPCKVFRFPWIAGHSQTGRLRYLNNLYILRYLSFLKVNAMPSVPLPANVLPIDLCVELALKLFFNDETPFEIFNVGHPQPQKEQEFSRVAKEEMGKELEVLDWTDFSEKLQKNNIQIDALKDLYKEQKSISMYIADAVGIVTGYLVSPETFFRNEKVSRFIPDFERHVEPSMEIVRRDLKYLKSIGFLEKFGI